MDKNQREARRRQEDVALNRGLLWVGGAVVLECLLLLVNRYYINFLVSEIDQAIMMKNVLSAVRAVGGVAGLLALIWSVLQFQKGAAGAGKFTVVGLVCCALAVCAHVTLVFQKPGVQMLFILVPAWAGLALVYYLYHREFFLSAAATGLAVLGLWFVRYHGVSLESIAALAAIVLVAAAALWLKKHDGVVRRGEEELRVLSKKTNYGVVLASCLAGLVAMAAAMVLGANIAYYLIFAMIAWLFALLVYYTVKMM